MWYNLGMETLPQDSAANQTGLPRGQWPTRIGTLQEMEGNEADLSATTTVEERFAIMWQLAQDFYTMRGEPVPEPDFSKIVKLTLKDS